MTLARHRLGDGVAAVTLAVGLILIASAGVHWRHDRVSAVAFGDPTLSRQEPVHAPTRIAARAVSPKTKPTSAAAPGVPTRLLIPDLGISAPVDPVNVTRGQLAVPDDISRVGWWNGSKPVGTSTGTTVIDGHIDAARYGLGALFNITRLRAGDTIVVSTDATRFTYRVYAAGTYRKASGLPPDLFISAGPGRLVLISCGGPFNPATHSYVDNVAVFAALQNSVTTPSDGARTATDPAAASAPGPMPALR